MSVTAAINTINAPTFLLLGDSLVAGFDWQKRIPNFSIRNCGVPGATTHDLLQAIPALKSHYSSAQLVMIMIGTNDIVMNKYDFIEELTQIIVFLTHNYSGAEVLVNSLLPIKLPNLDTKAITSINNHIAAICRKTGSCFVDVHARFLQAEGQLFEDDGVHVTETGYELWSRTILEHIAFLLEND